MPNADLLELLSNNDFAFKPGAFKREADIHFTSLRCQDEIHHKPIHVDLISKDNMDWKRLGYSLDITVNTAYLTTWKQVGFFHPQGAQDLGDAIIRFAGEIKDMSVNRAVPIMMRAITFSLKLVSNKQGKQFRLLHEDKLRMREFSCQHKASEFTDYKSVQRILDKLFLTGYAAASFKMLAGMKLQLDLLKYIFPVCAAYLKNKARHLTNQSCWGYIIERLKYIDKFIAIGVRFNIFQVLPIFYAKQMEDSYIHSPIDFINHDSFLSSFSAHLKMISSFTPMFDCAKAQQAAIPNAYRYKQKVPGSAGLFRPVSVDPAAQPVSDIADPITHLIVEPAETKMSYQQAWLKS